jgi:1,4-dihydroxy-2-naphthoate polyprenyltransferase
MGGVHPLRVWVMACRPKTLFAAVSPVMLGGALAHAGGVGNAGAVLAALAGAVFIQIGTNLANDYWDARKGADTEGRLGPVRVTAAGLLAPGVVFRGMLVSFALATLAGAWLLARAGWPVAVIGLAGIACGILYTAGPVPLAYVGLGDVFTFVFFGVVATAGTFYVQALEWSAEAAVLGIVPGSYSVVLIALNNLRDREGDVVAGKRTLAVRFGAGFARAEILCCLALPAVVAWWCGSEGLVAGWMGLVAAGAALAGGLAVGVPVLRIRRMEEINGLFPVTGALGLGMAVILSVFLLL